VLDSDGTVIFTHGLLTSGSKLTQKLAHQHGKPCLHIDLNQIPDYHAVFLVREWMYENDVEVLNVTGSRASKDPLIYKRVFDIIKGVYWTDRIKGQTLDFDKPEKAPTEVNTVDEAVEQILAELPLRDRAETANMTEEDLVIVQAVLAKYISEKLDGWTVNSELYEDCQRKAEGELLDKADAATVILRVLWNRLQETHRLRAVK
jgi:hypothetical protein